MHRPNLPWPLIRLAVLCSEEAYNTAVVSSAQRCNALERTLVSQRTVELHGKIIVVALTGTRGVRDWIVNLKNRPHDSRGLFGVENPCHGGFLNASRSLIDPLATCLDNYKDKSTLLFTGHSAGAATASLLYAHVLSKATSRLITVTKDFSNIHCILFGCPPISINPLQSHKREDIRSSRSLFLSFLNDGDPIIKADVEYIARRLGKPRYTLSDTFGGREHRKGKKEAPALSLAEKRPNRLFVHSGRILLLKLDVNYPSVPLIEEVGNDELDSKSALCWQVHGISVYKARIKSCEATHGDTETHVIDQYDNDNSVSNNTTRMRARNLTPWLFMVIL